MIILICLTMNQKFLYLKDNENLSYIFTVRAANYFSGFSNYSTRVERSNIQIFGENYLLLFCSTKSVTGVLVLPDFFTQ